MPRYELFTSESVTEGHPDKVADQISDAILDEAISIDKFAKVAVETLVTRGNIVLAGEIRLAGDGAARVIQQSEEIARKVIRDIGYTTCASGLEWGGCKVLVMLGGQSVEIGEAVDRGGAGDQGMMIGYATDETPQLMPLPIQVAHELTARLALVRRENPDLGLLPDGKSQVTVAYLDGKPDHFDTIVVSTQHSPALGERDVADIVHQMIIAPVLDMHPEYNKQEPKTWINPSGSFTIGGPEADTGLTGRKIIVDTYGGLAHHGGGSFSGKDPSKVDRSAAYAARLVAKNIVAAGLAKKCEIRIAYAIGIADPVAIGVDTFGTGAIPDADIEDMVFKRFDLTPRGIIEMLDLRRPIYLPTAKNGHFGKPQFSWEQIINLQ
ncbi:MAG TPA: methionine adenosyltransferase [Armatimonadota bacterium]|nr:methionine adenosyltransferase [Armatimonadota bacterium]